MSENKKMLKSTILKSLPQFKHVLFFSAIINVLMLAPTGYMLQVYGRVVNSRNHETLLMLTILVIGLYALLEVLDWVRVRMMQEAAVKLDEFLKEKVFYAVFSGRKERSSLPVHRAFEDLRVLREALPSPGLIAIIDAPLALLTLIILFWIHPRIGLFALFSVMIQFTIAWFNQRRMHGPLELAGVSNAMAHQYATSAVKNAEVVASMSMLGGVESRWSNYQQKYLLEQGSASDTAGTFAALSKMTQTLQGSLILGVGCWLALEGHISADGALIIGGSILLGRVMAPLVAIIGQWRQLLTVYQSYGRLSDLLENHTTKEAGMKLPTPIGHLKLEGVVVTPPGIEVPIIRGISFALEPGKVLAVLGPSASGKTTLARVIVGAWPTTSGKVRLDGADIAHWDKRDLGPHIGYLSQNIELFDGTIAENIARFGEINMEALIHASKWVGLDNIISNMPDGYETQVGFDGAFLSGGMRQRIGLARAIYNTPRLIVLDEPNSSLDEAGEAALMVTLQLLKQAGSSVVIVSHRPSILPAVDNMLILVDGQIKAYGPKDEVMAAMASTKKGVAPNAFPGVRK